MKKVVPLVVSLVLALTCLAGCSSGQSSASSQKEEPSATVSAAEESTVQNEVDQSTPEKFKIGFPWWTASTDPNWVSILNSVRAGVEAAGGELIAVETDAGMTADALINNIEELISRGVDGILFMPASDSMLPTVDAMCSEAGVYWATIFRTISDDSIREQIHASQWFAGSCNEDDEACAANIVKTMAEMGVKNLCCINIAKGDTSSDLRDMGAERGAKENGVNLLNTTYGITVTTEMTKAIESYIAAYPEMDGILLLGTYCEAALPTIEKALADHGKDGKVIVGRIDFDSTMGEYLEAGSFHVAYGGQMQIDTMMASLILANKVSGNPISEEGASVIITPYLKLTSAEDAENYTNYFLGDTPIYTQDEIKKLFVKFYNPDINEEYIYGVLDTFSISDVVERHK